MTLWMIVAVCLHFKQRRLINTIQLVSTTFDPAISAVVVQRSNQSRHEDTIGTAVHFLLVHECQTLKCKGLLRLTLYLSVNNDVIKWWSRLFTQFKKLRKKTHLKHFSAFNGIRPSRDLCHCCQGSNHLNNIYTIWTAVYLLFVHECNSKMYKDYRDWVCTAVCTMTLWMIVAVMKAIK